MYRLKNFRFLKVYDIKGKYMGFVDDVAINYDKGTLIGLKLNKKSLLSKERYVLVDDIIVLDSRVIASKIQKGSHLCFDDIKSLEVIDISGELLGVVSDIIIDYDEKIIRAIVSNPGVIEKITRGKDVICIKHTILGENNIICLENRSNIKMISLSTRGKDKG